MRKYPKRNKIFLSIWLLMELILFLWARRCEAVPSGFTENIVKFSAIAINALFAAFFRFGYAGAHQRENLIAYALFVTVIADFFLTLLASEEYYFAGFVMFDLVELLYLLYLKPEKRFLLIEAFIYVIVLIIAQATGNLSFENAFGALDLVLVSGNAVYAWAGRKEKIPLLFAVGITLFMGCDLSILLRAVTSGTLHRITAWLIWLFYAPSQICIALAYAQSVMKRQS